MSHVEPWAAPVSIALLEHQRWLREAARGVVGIRG